jgi:hypothetical protein
MAMLKWLLGLVFGLLVLVVAGGFLLPSTVHVERDILIQAEPSQVFPLVSDLNAWDAWSPWAQRDPDATMEITGSGVGQTMTWASENPQVGSGTQEIVALSPDRVLKTHLDFGAQGLADAAFQLFPEGDQTRVVWSLDTDMRAGVPLWQQPLSTYLGFAMDSMIGQDYEAGLQKLKTVAEGNSGVNPA